MPPSSRTLLLFAALIAGTAPGAARATDLRLYSSFAEVREPLEVPGKSYTLTLPQSVWNNIVPGSLGLEGLRAASLLQTSPQKRWLEGLEGQTVVLRENGRQSRVTLVRARDLLIRDAQGVYRTVQAGQLAFLRPPPETTGPARTLNFTLAQPGRGTLTYLTNGLGWSPRYVLEAAGNRGTLSGLADLSNRTAQSYRVTNTELLAGEVRIMNQGSLVTQSGAIPLPSMATATSSVGAGTTTPVRLSTVGGLYRYGLKAAYTLPPSSTLTLPFLTTALDGFYRYASLQTQFSPQDSQDALDRSYAFRAAQNLPGGLLTVREDGRIAGQTTLSDTARGAPISFTLGRDPDVRYIRTVRTLSTFKDGGSYRVTYRFQNDRAQPLRIEGNEVVYGKRVRIDGAVPRTSDPVRVPLNIGVPAHGSAERSFTVLIDNR